MKEKKYVVYKHTSPYNQIYIGITSRKPEQRWANGKGYSHNVYFTRAINKYGWDNFKHEILEESLTRSEANKKEVEYIIYYDCRAPKGYNITAGGDGYTGFKGKDNPRYGTHLSDSTRKKISKARITRGYSKGKNNPMYGKTFTDEHRENMSNALKGRISPNLGKHMSESTKNKLSLKRKGVPISEEHRLKIIVGLTGRKCSENTKQKLRKVNGTQVYQFNEFGELIRSFVSINEACKETDTDKSQIIYCCKGIAKFANGYMWSYSNNITNYIKPKTHNPTPKRVMQINKDNLQVIKTFNSISIATEETNIKNISYACNGKRKTAGGYIWRYAD